MLKVTPLRQESARANSSGITYYPIAGTSFVPKQMPDAPHNLKELLTVILFMHTYSYGAKLGAGVGLTWLQMYMDIRGLEGGNPDIRRKNGRQVAIDLPIARFVVQPEVYGDGIEELDHFYPYDSISEQYGAAIMFGGFE